MFMLYYDAKAKTVRSLNGSGRCATALTAARVREDLGLGPDARAFPKDLRRHVHAITVPGAAAGWADAVEAWGSGMSLSEVLAPAAKLAEDGFPVSPMSAAMWAADAPALTNWKKGGHASELLIADGAANAGLRAPFAGELFKNPNLARVLKELGAGGKKAFYSGTTGEAIAAAVAAEGGLLTAADLAAHTSTFDQALSVDYHGVDIWECPPNGQGITALVAANILRSLDVASMERGSAQHYHTLIEAVRLAFADTRYYVADPAFSKIPVKGMLDPAYGRARAGLIDPTKASVNVLRGSPVAGSDTVSFQVVDGAGNAVSMVNSVYLGFGSGLVPEGCGFALQNRGANFVLEPDHPNRLEGGKRPYHTIIPCMLTQGGELLATMTNMGGFMQPQGHINLLCNMIDFGLDPQAAIDAPRFCIQDGTKDGVVSLENTMAPEVVEQLRAMGHNLEPAPISGAVPAFPFGRAQIILRDVATGVLCAGSDGRCDGCAMGW